MTPERWQQIKTVLDQALELKTEERAAFLDHVCSVDASLRKEVEKLLAGDDEVRSSFLRTSPFARLSLSSGTRLGDYEVQALIGSGGMGEVYRAHDLRLGRDVAIKVLPSLVSSNPDRLRRFEQEARAAAALNHPNILAVYQMGTYEGAPYLVSELLEGQTLREQTRREPLPAGMVIDYSLQTARGLTAAHGRGIVHRDLKPENLFVTQDGLIKILDFGLAKILQPKADSSRNAMPLSGQTEPGMVMGTAGYMSPEQVRGQETDHRADIFAFGAILYEMLTGQRAFHGETAADTMSLILKEDPPDISEVAATSPPKLQQIVRQCLEKNRERRLQSAAELVTILESIKIVPIKVEPPPRSRPKWFAAGILCLAGILVAGVAVGLNVGKIRDRIVNRRAYGRVPLSPPASPIPARRSVAVLGFKNVSGRTDSAWLSPALSEMLTTELGAGGQIRTIAEENVVRAKMDLSVSDVDSLAKDTLAQVRNNLGTDYVLLGSFVDLGKEEGGQVRVDLRLQDARTGETMGVVSETGTEGELFGLVSRAGHDLRSELGIGSISQAEAGGVRAALAVNSDAARFYAEGLARLRVFDALAARDLLTKAVGADPNYALAHSALSAAWAGLGYDARAAEQAKMAFDLSGNLPREDQLSIEGRYYEAIRSWPKAIDVYRRLSQFAPDNLDYGLRLAEAQTSGSLTKDALTTLAGLRNLPAPTSEDPRIDIDEAVAARGQSDFKRELAATLRATEKSEKLGARLLLGRAQMAQARAYYDVGDFQKFQSSAETARRIFAEAGNRGAEAMALHNLAAGLYDHGDRAGALKTDEQALDTCRKIGNQRCIADVLNNMGLHFKDQSDFTGARQAYEQSIAIRREIGDRSGEALSLSNVAVLLDQQGKLAAAKKVYEQSLAITLETGEKRGIARVLTNLAIIYQEQGQLIEARKLHEQSIALRREIGDKYGTAVGLNNLATVLLDLGDLTAMQKALDEQIPVFQQAGVPRGLAYSLSVQGQLFQAQGDLSQARKAYEQALAIRSKSGDKLTVADSTLALAMISILEGHPADAEQPARQVLQQAQAEKEGGQEVTARNILALSLLGQGKAVQAEKEIRVAEGIAATTESRLLAIDIRIASARVYAVAGKGAKALQMLNGALAEATKLGCGRCQFDTRLALGEIEMKQENKKAARVHLTALEKDASSKGFLLIAHQAHDAAMP